MNLFKMFRKEKKELPKIVKVPERHENVQIVQHHRTRIDNLNNELIVLSDLLKSLHDNDSEQKSKKFKDIDIAIRRMTIIQYEIDIREGLLQWL